MRPVGTVTSGNFSPMLGHGIALALLDSTVDVGRMATPPQVRPWVSSNAPVLPARVVATPFVRPGQWASGR